MLESLIVTVIVLALLGFLVYVLITYVPMPAPFKQAIVVVCVVVIVRAIAGSTRRSLNSRHTVRKPIVQ
jgi:uncharacterized membrane protein YqjE